MRAEKFSKTVGYSLPLSSIFVGTKISWKQSIVGYTTAQN